VTAHTWNPHHRLSCSIPTQRIRSDMLSEAMLLHFSAFAIALACFAAPPDGAALYKQRCAMCHDRSAETRAPAPTALRQMSPENIVRSLESGIMKDQGALLSAVEKIGVAEFLTGKIGSTSQQSKTCASNSPFSLTGPQWNGWGTDLSNTRFQPAGLTAAQVPNLKLKWAFAFPGTFVSNGPPIVAGGRVFVPSANRTIYSLDQISGCQYWSFEAEAPVRTAITIAAIQSGKRRHAAFFGDQRGNAYALDASTGELLWKTHIDDQPRARIVGAPVFYDGRLYVPLTDGEEGPQSNPKFECCSGRGALVALDASTGHPIWKTYTISEAAQVTGKNAAGITTWGPSGASIWSAPTIDPERKLIYAGTGDNFSDPATNTSDAVIAFDMNDGKIVWIKQLTEDDVFNLGCNATLKHGCRPDGTTGPDFDIGASPMLVKLANGKRVLLVSQKSGVAHGLDPDREGEILWRAQLGHGSALGGIQWGSATDGKNMYAALSDIGFLFTGTPLKRILDPKAGGGLFALDVATGTKVWEAQPPLCGDRLNCSPAQSAAISAIPGAVFSGSADGHLRDYSTADGKVIWDFDTTSEFSTVNGITAKGGSMDGPGPVIAGNMLLVPSGYPAWGGLPGNILLAFTPDEK
jgi:polyvinyl alcohol dehydrogenase (cytochrome)